MSTETTVENTNNVTTDAQVESLRAMLRGFDARQRFNVIEAIMGAAQSPDGFMRAVRMMELTTDEIKFWYGHFAKSRYMEKSLSTCQVRRLHSFYSERRRNRLERKTGRKAPLIKVLTYNEKSDYDKDWLTVTLAKYGFEYADLVSMETCYFFDARRHFNLCELTPSYELHLYDNRVIFKDEIEAYKYLETGNPLLNNFESCREELENEMRFNESENTIIYQHCHDVESHIDAIADKDFRYREWGYDLEFCKHKETTYDEYMEAMLEHFQGNAPL